ncbi:hypothetical protein V8E55_011502 [Tylopilus felleus]
MKIRLLLCYVRGCACTRATRVASPMIKSFVGCVQIEAKACAHRKASKRNQISVFSGCGVRLKHSLTSLEEWLPEILVHWHAVWFMGLLPFNASCIISCLLFCRSNGESGKTGPREVRSSMRPSLRCPSHMGHLKMSACQYVWRSWR